MSDIKCPFCDTELAYLDENTYGHTECSLGLVGNQQMWETLIKLKKKLDIYEYRLKQIANHPCEEACYCLAQNALDAACTEVEKFETTKRKTDEM